MSNTATDPFAAFPVAQGAAPSAASSPPGSAPTAPPAGAATAPATAPAQGFDAFPVATSGQPAPASPSTTYREPAGGTTIKAYSPTLGQRIREAFSPVLGETHDETAARKGDIQALQNISPDLANAAFDPQREIDMEKGALHKGAMMGAALGLRGVVPAAAATLAAPLGPGASAFAGGAAGMAGDDAYQRLEMLAGDRKATDVGELLQSGVFGAAGALGAPLAEEGIASAGKQAAVQGLAGLGGETVRTAVDEGRTPTLKEAAMSTAVPAAFGALAQGVQLENPTINAARQTALAQTAEKRAVLDAAKDAGLVVKPSTVNPDSSVNRFIEGFSGSPALKQEATIRNYSKLNELARQVIDPEQAGAPLDSETARAVRDAAYERGYEPLTQLGRIPVDGKYAQDLANILQRHEGVAKSFPGLEDNAVLKKLQAVAVPSFESGIGVQAIQKLRNDASDAFRNGNTNLAKASKEAAGAIEDLIERHITRLSGAAPEAAAVSPIAAARNVTRATVVPNAPDAPSAPEAIVGGNSGLLAEGKPALPEPAAQPPPLGLPAANEETGIVSRDDSKLTVPDLEKRILALPAAADEETQLGPVASRTSGAATPIKATVVDPSRAAQMLKDFRDARTLMAQAHDVEDSIREGGNAIIPSVLARKYQNQAPLSGNLETIGAFANNFKDEAKEAPRVTVPGTTVTGKAMGATLASILGGSTLASTHEIGPTLAASALGFALPSTRAAVRKLVLSAPYQRLFAKIPVNVKAAPDTAALVTRELGQEQGAQDANPSPPEE